MGYGKKVYDEAITEINSRKQSAERIAAEHKNQFFADCERASEIENEKVRCVAGIAKAIILGGNVREKVTKLREESLRLQTEFNALLRENGLTERDISPSYTCEKCSDTGFNDGRMCICLKNLQRQIAYKKLSMNTPLQNSTFDNFSLSYYPDSEKQNMAAILKFLVGYANNFTKTSPSLLFRGGTGLGKTHLSLAIANEVLNKGFGVIYTSVYNLAAAIENERFDKDDESTYSQMLDCDLLILDDLGTEYSSNYINSSIYNLIDTRILSQKPTIISTNLNVPQMEQRYSDRFASRLFGQFGVFTFDGDDIRKEKRKR